MLELVAAALVVSAAPDPNAAVARVAARYLRDKPRLRREDCSGLVNDVLRDAGFASSGGAAMQWAAAAREGRIVADRDDVRPGDLVFFDRTYDSNRNGRVDDLLTHVAVVVRLERGAPPRPAASRGGTDAPSGSAAQLVGDAPTTIVMVHRSASKIEELRMSLRAPSDPRVNSYLRSKRYGSAKDPRLAGALFHGHARPAQTGAPPAVSRATPSADVERSIPMDPTRPVSGARPAGDPPPSLAEVCALCSHPVFGAPPSKATGEHARGGG